MAGYRKVGAGETAAGASVVMCAHHAINLLQRIYLAPESHPLFQSPPAAPFKSKFGFVSPCGAAVSVR
jgi:hypothetical protein